MSKSKTFDTINDEKDLSDSTDTSTETKTQQPPASTKPELKVYQGYNPIENASLFSRLTFSWLNPVIAASHAAKSKGQALTLAMLGNQRAEDKCTQSIMDDLEQKFKSYLA